MSSFALIYEIEAIIPIVRTEIPEEANSEALSNDLDMTDEPREAAAMRISSYQQRLTSLYNKHVKLHALKVGDLVMRKVFENTVNPAADKFQPN